MHELLSDHQLRGEDPLSLMVRGLFDANIQEKILFKAADKKMELTLQDITNSVEALEIAKRDQAPPQQPQQTGPNQGGEDFTALRLTVCCSHNLS